MSNEIQRDCDFTAVMTEIVLCLTTLVDSGLIINISCLIYCKLRNIRYAYEN